MTAPIKTQDDIKSLVGALVDEAQRLGLIWTMRPARVVNGSDPIAVTVIMDGDTSNTLVPAVSLIGTLGVGTRVMTRAVPPAGLFIDGLAARTSAGGGGGGGGAFGLGVLRRGRRTTNASVAGAAPSETPVLRVDNIPAKAGHFLKVTTSNVPIDVANANAGVAAVVRWSSTGPATVASTEFGAWQVTVPATNEPPVLHLTAFYPVPLIDQTLSILLSCVHNQGIGNVTMLGSTTLPIDLIIEDMGVDVGDTGVDL